jgi:predicted RNase H-like nuclease
VLAAPTYADARAVARELLGKGISAQTYGIRRIVLAVDDALRAGPGEPAGRWAVGQLPQVLEVHPELSFMAMSGRGPGDPLPSKRTPAGRRARVEAVGGWLRPGLALDPPDGDDHLDALAAAWSAWRWACGTAEELGGEPDEVGLPMRIVI